MTNPLLDSVRSKIDRANSHLADIKALLRVVLDSADDPESSFRVETHGEGKQLILVLRLSPKEQKLDSSLPLLIGDCVHNLRSALDHLVFQLAKLNGAGKTASEQTFFPIYLDKATFDKRVKTLVEPHISASAVAEIEKCQPFSAYAVPDESDLWILSKLDIIDKHRLLIVANQKVGATEFRLTVPTGDAFHERISEPKWKPMEDGTELLRFDLSRALYAPGKVHVQVNLMTPVQLDKTGLRCDGVVVEDALRQCSALTSAIVRDFGVMFFNE